MLKMH